MRRFSLSSRAALQRLRVSTRTDLAKILVSERVLSHRVLTAYFVPGRTSKQRERGVQIHLRGDRIRRGSVAPRNIWFPLVFPRQCHPINSKIRFTNLRRNCPNIWKSHHLLKQPRRWQHHPYSASASETDLNVRDHQKPIHRALAEDQAAKRCSRRSLRPIWLYSTISLRVSI